MGQRGHSNGQRSGFCLGSGKEIGFNRRGTQDEIEISRDFLRVGPGRAVGQFFAQNTYMEAHD